MFLINFWSIRKPQLLYRTDSRTRTDVLKNVHYLRKELRPLHTPLITSDGFSVGSSTISTTSAPLGSSGGSVLAAGKGGGGGGAPISPGIEVALFNNLGASVVSPTPYEVTFAGTEFLADSFNFSPSSSELSVDCEDDKPLSCEFFLGCCVDTFLSIFSYFCGLGRNSFCFLTSFRVSLLLSFGVEDTLTMTLLPELEELVEADLLCDPESLDRDLTLFVVVSLLFDSSCCR